MVGQTLFFAAGAYLLGAVPFGKIIAKMGAQIDITQRGSKNIGATNVARELGLKWGVLTLVCDTLKGPASNPCFFHGLLQWGSFEPIGLVSDQPLSPSGASIFHLYGI